GVAAPGRWGPHPPARRGPDTPRAVAQEGPPQLTSPRGLPARGGDAPACVTEGLATYGEVRNRTGRTAPGQLNRMRLGDLASVQRRGVPWVPVARLLEDDRLLTGGPFEGLLAYAESWLLVDLL